MDNITIMAKDVAAIVQGNVIFGREDAPVVGVCELKNPKPHCLTFANLGTQLWSLNHTVPYVVIVDEHEGLQAVHAVTDAYAVIGTPWHPKYAWAVAARTLFGHSDYYDCNRPPIAYSAVIGRPGFGFARSPSGVPERLPHFGAVLIGKGVEVGAHACIDRGTIGDTIIGDDVKIDNLVHIAHNVKVGARTLIAAGAILCGGCEIGEDCFIGVGAMIRQKIKVGNGCTIGMGSVVVKNVHDGATVAGNPAVVIAEGGDHDA